MTAELVMTQAEIDKDPEGWLEKRREFITASEIGSVLGISPGAYSSAYSLYWSKLDGDPPREATPEQEVGLYMEQFVADKFAVAYPHLTVGPGGLYRSSERPWQAATFDRLAYDGPGWDDYGGWDGAGGFDAACAVAPVQLKTAGTAEEWGSDPEEGKVPYHYRAQCLQEMDVLGSLVVFLPVMFLFSRKIRVYEIARDRDAELDIELMRDAAVEFLQRIADRRPPKVDWSPAAARTLKQRHPSLEDRSVRVPLALRDQYIAAQRMTVRAKHAMGLAQNQLRERMGSAAEAVIFDPETGRELRVCSRSKFHVNGGYRKGYDVDALYPGKAGKP